MREDTSMKRAKGSRTGSARSVGLTRARVGGWARVEERFNAFPRWSGLTRTYGAAVHMRRTCVSMPCVRMRSARAVGVNACVRLYARAPATLSLRGLFSTNFPVRRSPAGKRLGGGGGRNRRIVNSVVFVDGIIRRLASIIIVDVRIFHEG